MTYVDAILHIADYPALAAALAARQPALVSETGQITGFDATPVVRHGPAALVYVRLSRDAAAQWRGTPGVTVLAEAPYGPASAEMIHAAIDALPEARALYDAVYAPGPDQPARFGVLG